MVGGAWEPGPFQSSGFLACALQVLASLMCPSHSARPLGVVKKSEEIGVHCVALLSGALCCVEIGAPCISLLSDRLGSGLAAKIAFLASQKRFAWC